MFKGFWAAWCRLFHTNHWCPAIGTREKDGVLKTHYGCLCYKCEIFHCFAVEVEEEPKEAEEDHMFRNN